MISTTRGLSVVVAAAGVTFLLEGCGSEESHPTEWSAECDKGCKPHVSCKDTGAEVTVPKECTNQAFLDDLVGENETLCEDWIKHHESDAEKKTQCQLAMSGESASFLADCDDDCLITFACNEEDKTLIPSDKCKNQNSEKTQSNFNDCKKSFESLGDDWGKRTDFCKKFRGDLPKYDNPESGAFHLPCPHGTPPKECQFTVVCDDGQGKTTIASKHCPSTEYPHQFFSDTVTCKNTVKMMHDEKTVRDDICKSLMAGARTTTTTTHAPATLVPTTHAPATHAPTHPPTKAPAKVETASPPKDVVTISV